MILWRSEFLPASVTSSKLVYLSNRQAICKAASALYSPATERRYTTYGDKVARTGLASPPIVSYSITKTTINKTIIARISLRFTSTSRLPRPVA